MPSRGGLSPREKAYMPHIPSPLNPLSSETPPTRDRRYRTARSELSPTQILMRHKAATAWKSMASRNALINSAQKTRNGASRDLIEQEEEFCLVQDAAEYDAQPVLADKCHEDADLDIQSVDTEKQALVDYQERISLDTNNLSNLWTTRRLVTVVGIVLFIGVLSAVRAIGRIQAWRT
ncbi:hypothetical protein F4819DRAFT_177658 [Hypoxylon fuscum]|nr:hypothetical protein F4819DRAFT_177658 [Hypoxylon fuscum]